MAVQSRRPYLDIDVSEVNKLMLELRNTLTPQNYRLVMYRAFMRAANKARTEVKRTIPKDYEAKSSWILQNLGKPQVSVSSEEAKCVIPVKGTRGILGVQFKASGPRNAVQLARQRKTYTIKSKQVRGITSELPKSLEDHKYYSTDEKVFYVPKGKYKGRVFVRAGKQRNPIIRLAGLNVPSMPINRSEKKVREAVLDTLYARIKHEHEYLVQQIASRL